MSARNHKLDSASCFNGRGSSGERVGTDTAVWQLSSLVWWEEWTLILIIQNWMWCVFDGWSVSFECYLRFQLQFDLPFQWLMLAGMASVVWEVDTCLHFIGILQMCICVFSTGCSWVKARSALISCFHGDHREQGKRVFVLRRKCHISL